MESRFLQVDFDLLCKKSKLSFITPLNTPNKTNTPISSSDLHLHSRANEAGNEFKSVMNAVSLTVDRTWPKQLPLPEPRLQLERGLGALQRRYGGGQWRRWNRQTPRCTAGPQPGEDAARGADGEDAEGAEAEAEK